MAASLFIGGTGSNVGKSWMVTAICASLRRRGLRVAPFKAQTMSNHSYPCVDGGEIGRAQVVQAQACGLDPVSAMNPILLKPNANGTSQVVVRGRAWRTLTARDYHLVVRDLWPEIDAAHAELARDADVVVMEGAGSVSEINLRGVDVTNLAMAARVDAPWVMVADIERGGVFAAVAGTVGLIDDDDRRRLRGVLVNKFRGDLSLFDDGRRLMGERCGTPCLGVWPYASDIAVDAEDSLAMPAPERVAARGAGAASVAIVRLPVLSNGTDFRLLAWADWIDTPGARRYDVVIVPGTKDTIGALAWMKARRLDAWIRDQHASGATVIGICGGFQILGETIADPDGVESSRGVATGLGLLPVDTVLTPVKTTAVRRATTPGGATFDAYEIHVGVTTARARLEPFAHLEDGRPEGVRHGRVIGTYLHGALENGAVCAELLGIDMPDLPDRASTYTRLADWFDAHGAAFEAALRDVWPRA